MMVGPVGSLQATLRSRYLLERELGRLWADRYDRELRDVFAVQDELAQAIAGALMPSLRL